MQRTTLTTGMAAALFTFTIGCATAPRERSVAWDVMKWRSGESVEAPLIENGDVVLRGQDLRTRTTYSVPVTVEVEAQLKKRQADAGMFSCLFVPSDQSTNTEPQAFLAVMLQHSPTRNVLVVMRRSGTPHHDETIFGQSVTHQTGQPYRLKMAATTTGLRVTLDGRRFEVPAAKVPYDRFYIELSGVPPADHWHVRDFVVR